jgi:hypothetical protein
MCWFFSDTYTQILIRPEASATQPRQAQNSQVCRIFLHTYFQRME